METIARGASLRQLLVLLAFAVSGCTASGRVTPPDRSLDPLAEARHETHWIEVVPAPLPDGLPLLGPDGVDEAGYPRRVVDRAALRSLFVRREFARLTRVLEEFQSEFEKDARYEERINDAYEALGYPHSRERELIDAWVEATPRSFAPYLASATFWMNTGFLWRGTKLAHRTSAGEFGSMEEAFDRARRDLQRAVALRPRLLYPDLVAISIEVAGGSRDSAVRAMEHGLALCPSCLTIRTQWLWALEPRWGGSIEEMEEFATRRADPGNPRHKILPGVVLLERASQARADGRIDDALALLDQACAIGGDWSFFEARARNRGTAAGVDSYLADLDRANAIHPGLTAVLSVRAWALNEKGNLEDAGRDLLYVLRARPNSGWGVRIHRKMVQALDAQGWNEHLAGNDGAAARLYELARALAPEDNDVANHARLALVPVGEASHEADPPSTLEKGKPTLTVRVVDDSGAPVARARIAITPENGGWPITSHLVREIAKGKQVADATGTARLSVSPGPQTVLAVRPEGPLVGAVASVTVPTTGAGVRLVLGGATEITGRTLDDAGQPVAGVQFLAAPNGPQVEAESRKVAAGVSSADGSFVIRGVDDQGYMLLRPGEDLMLVTKGGTTGLVTRQHSKAELRGRVLLSQADQPARFADHFSIRFNQAARAFTAEAEGRFALDVPQWAGGALWISVEGRPTVQRIIERPQGQVDLGDVVVGPGRSLRGLVVDPEGYPVINAGVGLRWAPPLGYTRGNGTFEVTVPNGPVDLRVSHKNWLESSTRLEGDEQELRISLSEGASFKILVTGPGGKPLEGATWHLSGANKGQPCTTDPTGRCSFTGLAATEYTLAAVAAPALGPNPPKPPLLVVPIPAEGTRGAALRWEKDHATLTIHVNGAGANAQGVARRRIRLLPGRRAFGEVFDRDGNVKVPYYRASTDGAVENLPPGWYTVVAVDAQPPKNCAHKDVLLRGGEQQVVALELAADGCR